MKKLIKGCLIAGGILIVLGFGICIAAGISGWNQFRFGMYHDYYESWEDRIEDRIERFDWDFDDMMYAAIRADEHMVPSGTPGMQGAPGVEEIPSEAQAGKTGQEYAFSDIQKLDIELSGGEIRMVPVEGSEEIKVIVGEGVTDYQCYVEERTLKIRSWKRQQKESHQVMEIQIPKNLSFLEADIQIQGGSLIAEELFALESNIEVHGGTAKILSGTTEMMDVNMNAGFFFMDGDVTRKADVSCNAGKVQLVLAGTGEDYGVSCEVYAGAVEVGGTSYRGRQQVGRDLAKQLELECSAGNIEVNFHG